MTRKIFVSILVFMFCLSCSRVMADGAPPDTEKGILCQLHFDEAEGTDIKDSSGNNLNGKIYGFSGAGFSPGGLVARTDGISGRALKLDGTSKVVLDNKALNLEGPFTLELWVKTTGGISWIFFVNNYINGVDAGVKLRDTGESLRFDLSKNKVESSSVSSKINIRDGKWHYIVVVYDGALIKLYIDGKLDPEAVAFYKGGYYLQRSIHIGGGVTQKDMFNGEIDEITVKKGSLTAEEIKAEYDKMTGTH